MNLHPALARCRAAQPLLPVLVAALVSVVNPAAAQPGDIDTDNPEELVLTWHKISGTPFDYDRAVNFSPRIAGQPVTFDRPEIVKEEKARLQAIHGAGSKGKIFIARVSDSIGQYDHDRGEFPIGLFQPGIYLQFPYTYVDYRLVFANGAPASAIRMPKEQARAFDQQLARARNVTTEVRFRVIGAGDPMGNVGGDRVMRGELVSVRLLDRNDQVVFAPDIKALADMPPPPKFATAEVDIAGMRIGGEAGELQSSLERLYADKVNRVEGDRDGKIDKRYAGYLEIDLITCMGGGYRRRDPQPGDVCLRAYYDDDEIIRTLIVVRVLPWMDAEQIRKAAVTRYGEITAGGGLTLGWGPAVDPKLLSYRVADGRALTLNVSSPSNFMADALNSRPRMVVALQLTDPEWAAQAKPLR
jgi:hypothetical protein